MKKYLNNEYIRGGGVWVRNFASPECKTPINLSGLYDQEDFPVIVENEQVNYLKPKIANESLTFPKIVIVSDGYDFHQRHHIVASLPPDVCVLAVNGALKDWKVKRAINAYIVNNPYHECMSLMPKPNGYYPVCVASSRTNHRFTEAYKNDVYVYCPTPEKQFGMEHNENYFLDDYRNPICAAIGLAYQFGVEKLMLLCCDESFAQPRDYAVHLENGLWAYPQHIMLQEIIDANLYWLTHQKDKEVVVADFSDGVDYLNASYINDEKAAIDFFKSGEEPNGKTQ